MNKRLTREACIKIIEQAERTEAEFADCFTAAVTGDSMHDIYKVSVDPRKNLETIKISLKACGRGTFDEKASFTGFSGHI